VLKIQGIDLEPAPGQASGMQRLTFLIPTLMALTLAGGCVVSGHAHVRSRAYVDPQPELVYVSPGVYVIADYSEPVFYSDNYYWLYRDGYWYRSGYYTGGWVRVRSTPYVISRIDRPHAYVRYRGEGRARVRVRDQRDGRSHDSGRRAKPAKRERVRVRDHR
jgi:hypothetical protein